MSWYQFDTATMATNSFILWHMFGILVHKDKFDSVVIFPSAEINVLVHSADNIEVLSFERPIASSCVPTLYRVELGR